MRHYFVENMVKIVKIVLGGLILSAIVYSYLFIDNYFREVILKYPEHSGIDRSDFGLSIFQYLDKYGYQFEDHEVITEDEYILGIHRILKNDTKTINKPVVLLQHCFVTNSFSYVHKGPNKSLGLILADKGWDVWLGNNRGNIYSRKHVKLDPDKDDKFWDFSLDEFGIYDLPATIDYIRWKTGQEKIYFIGYSQGVTQFLIMASARPEYNNKISALIALAPTVYLENVKSSVILFMYNFKTLLVNFAKVFGIHEIFPVGHKLYWLFELTCTGNFITVEFCRALVYTTIGYSPEQYEKNLVSLLINNKIPSGVSLKLLEHYYQFVKSDKFTHFDYGEHENLRRHNSTEPLNVNMSAVTVPTAFYYSIYDKIATFEDVDRLSNKLPNVIKKTVIDHPKLEHLDFLWAKDINKIVYKDIVNLMDNLRS